MSDNAKEIDEKEFNSKFKAPSSKLVPLGLVDFWAPWCGPCMAYSPIIDELASEYPQIECCKLNVDKAQATAVELQIRSIPTVIIFKNGKPVESIVGVVSKSTLKQAIEKFIE